MLIGWLLVSKDIRVINDGQITSFNDLGMIAFSRCIYTTRFTGLTFIEKYRKSVILLIWLYAIIMFLIELYWNKDNKIGYNCILGRCDIIQHPSKTYTIEIFTNYLFAWPSLLVLICYSYMGWHFYKHHKNQHYLQIGKWNFKIVLNLLAI